MTSDPVVGGNEHLTKGVDCRHRSVLLFFTSRSCLSLFCLLLVSNCLNVEVSKGRLDVHSIVFVKLKIFQIIFHKIAMFMLVEDDDDITDDSSTG